MCKGVLKLSYSNGHVEKLYDVKMNKKRQKRLPDLMKKKVIVVRVKGHPVWVRMTGLATIEFTPNKELV